MWFTRLTVCGQQTVLSPCRGGEAQLQILAPVDELVPHRQRLPLSIYIYIYIVFSWPSDLAAALSPCHSRMLEHPIYMWGCKGLYQERDETPEFAEGRDQTLESYYTKAHL
jgi:hypothetical protein